MIKIKYPYNVNLLNKLGKRRKFTKAGYCSKNCPYNIKGLCTLFAKWLNEDTPLKYFTCYGCYENRLKDIYINIIKPATCNYCTYGIQDALRVYEDTLIEANTCMLFNKKLKASMKPCNECLDLLKETYA